MLETFSGTVSIADPESLPEGVSPRCQNADFNIGSARTRQGLQNPFTYSSGSAGPSHGGSAYDTSLGGAVWNNPGNVLLNTGVYATASLIGLAGVTSVTVTNGGLYPLFIVSVGVSFSGPGPGGATATANLGTITVGHTTYKTVTSVTVTNPGLYSAVPTCFFTLGTPGAAGTASLGTLVASSDALDVVQFGFSVTSSSIPQGFEVAIQAFASDVATLNVQMLKAGSPVGSVESVPLNVGSPTTLTFGGINDLFGGSWLYSDLNNINFGLRITASASSVCTVSVGYTTLKAYFLPAQENFNFIATYEDDFGNIFNVALDAGGEFWIENVTTAPSVLTPLFGGPPENSFASAFTANSRQYLAISDLLQGNYPPQQIVGTTSAQSGWQDRVSQVGPGQAPAFQGTLTVGGTVSITAYSYSGGILTLTAVNTLTAGEVVTINAGSLDALFPLNGLSFNVLGTGLSGTQFEIA
jgi:hypothetical protein